MTPHDSTASPANVSLPRVPLVPDAVLRRSKAYFEIDTRFRRAARLLQCMWLTDHDIPIGMHVSGEAGNLVTMELGSNLSREAAEAGKNFLSPAIHALVRHTLVMREEGAMFDEERLFGNALSSMPLVFNLFGPMAIDLRLATFVFQRLLPEFVQSVAAIEFEHSPGRFNDQFLSDGTAVDLILKVVTPEAKQGIIFIEVKYSEDMSGPAARLRERYDIASREVDLFKDPDSALLRSLALEQLWREHMLTQLAVDNGVTSQAMFVAIGPRLNRRVQAAFRAYEAELIASESDENDRVPFKALTLEAVIDALADAGAAEIAKALWRRYCDFERVYHVALQEFAGATELNYANNSERSPNGQGDAHKAIGKMAKLVGTSTTTRSKAKPNSSTTLRGGVS
ncbi:hypothetical protein [Bradyrhizobium sp. ARR65]|uniref:PGN_0703 family putative restriction endonuclease n=1 Tax=Bradyrhizobium sp. ARR65 TaxID=1040989 RepID=UPI000AAC5BE1|nr:hypothetical protein [Bradyrhizobium sp. ARR65]